MLAIYKKILVALNSKRVPQVCRERTVDSDFPAQGVWTTGSLHQPFTISISNVSWKQTHRQQNNDEVQDTGEIREPWAQGWPKEGSRVLEVDTPGLSFQFCSFLAVCAHSASLSLSSLFSKVIFAELLWEVSTLLKMFSKWSCPYYDTKAVTQFVDHQLAAGL